MGVKYIVKKVLGSQGVDTLRKCNQYVKWVKGAVQGATGTANSQFEFRCYEKPGKHVFFGYYDLQQLNAAQDKLLAHVVDVRKEVKDTPIEICWIDRKSGEFHRINESRAWCWQQGSRLRWHPIDQDCVIFNGTNGDSYCSIVWNIEKDQLVDVIPRAMYDITKDFRFGLSLNFSRLQRLRPGYGYSCFVDETARDNAPENDGIFLCDLTTHESRLIISLKQLAAASSDRECHAQHYINHISIAPDGRHFMFFHLWTMDVNAPWKVELYAASLDGTELKRLETEEAKISHYCWKNEYVLLTTTSDGIYAEYDIRDGARKVLEYKELCHNGHPTYFANQKTFITDTYPLNKCVQHLFIMNNDGVGYKELACLFSDPRLFGEKRCDLHPRLTPDNKIVTIDTTYKFCKRSILEFVIRR